MQRLLKLLVLTSLALVLLSAGIAMVFSPAKEVGWQDETWHLSAKTDIREMLVRAQRKQTSGFGDTGVPKRSLRSGALTIIRSPMPNPTTHQTVPPPPV